MGAKLISVARVIVSKGEVPDVDFATYFWDDFAPTDRSAQKLWYFSRQFQDDADIRSKDAEYDRQQRDNVSYWLTKHIGDQSSVS